MLALSAHRPSGHPLTDSLTPHLSSFYLPIMSVLGRWEARACQS